MKTLDREFKKVFENLVVDSIIWGTYTSADHKIEIKSRLPQDGQLYQESLDVLFNTATTDSHRPPLVFYEHHEVSKNWQLYCPLPSSSSKEEEGGKEDGLILFKNIPLPVMILGQTKPGKVKVYDEANHDDPISEVTHTARIPKWVGLYDEPMMMDAHSLEAGSMHLNTLLHSENSKTAKKKKRKMEQEVTDTKLYAVATSMLDLRKGSRCMGVS